MEDHLRPFLAVARQLRSRGHEVVFYSDTKSAPMIELSGFRCFPFQKMDPAPLHHILWQLRSQNPKRLLVWRLWREFLLDSIPGQLEDLRSIAAEWRPNVVVSDVSMWSTFLVLHESEGIPVVPFSATAHCLIPGPDGPMSGMALPRPVAVLCKIAAQAGSRVADLMTRSVLRQANKFRADNFLTPLTCSVKQQSSRMPLYLVSSSPHFDRMRKDLPDTVQYIGPCFEDALGFPLRHRGDSGTLPARVLIDRGMPFARPRFLQLASSSLSGLNVESEFGDAFSLFASLPSANLVMTNGNSAMVLAALAHGIPLLVVPDSRHCSENAWRVHEQGAGIRISQCLSNFHVLRKAVQQILGSDIFPRNARLVAESFRVQGGASRAAELIEKAALTPACV